MIRRATFFLPFVGIICGLCLTLQAQVFQPPVTSAGGVYIDADGAISQRQTDLEKKVDDARTRARNSADANKERLAYVSLPKVFARAKALMDAGKPVPPEIKYLGGITQIRYVFVYPEDNDLVIAGPAEPWDATNATEPFGKRTGRPVLQLDDLVAAIRTTAQMQAAHVSEPFGCSIDPAADAFAKSSEVMKQFAAASRAERMEAMHKAVGPQAVRVFGTATDTRLAFVCVAADYKLKRIALGLDPAPAGVGNEIDDSRAAGNRVWFEANYDPLLVSQDGNGFEFRGNRLQLKAGALSFDTRGATPKALDFAKRFTEKMPEIATAIPIFADLQNVCDVSLLAELMAHDRLPQRIGWDTRWILDAKGYNLPSVPSPRTAETLVNYTNGSICCGGVSFTMAPLVEDSARVQDKTHALRQSQDARATAKPMQVEEGLKEDAIRLTEDVARKR